MSLKRWSAALAAMCAIALPQSRAAGADPVPAPGPAAVPAALTPEQAAAHVLNRLAYGPRPGDIERVMQMGVQHYIDTQLNPSTIALPEALTQRLATLDAAQQPAGTVLAAFLAVRGAARQGSEQDRTRRREVLQAMTQQTAEARIARAIDSPRQLEEVLVDFWYNHFNVFSGKGLDRALVASYERDAIRPYVMGNFRELLGATAHHPAMLYYLDNWLSTADGYTPRGKRQAAGPKGKSSGLNENYARELMELHTLGADGGYTQKDVTELARMLTGWTYNPRDLVQHNRGFAFDPRRHDQQDKRWLGREIKAGGQDEGEFALDVLAMLPATAHRLSFQLAQYFVQDQPPAALVERMARSYLDSKGELRAVLRTLFSSPEFMRPAALGAKFKTPYQYLISTARAAGTGPADTRQMMGALTRMGMPLYGCQTPDGYQNTQDAWLNPDALSRRISYAAALSPTLDAQALRRTLGASISPKTSDAIDASPPPLRATMLLGSPDFMQR
ncbi:DUF1800 domain-containing protein [Oxalobacteraceae bacterium]|nr:DUF1800 domain-containing protein [Oxalobacteraceae bacterium]